MKCTIPEISWHNRDPVLSVDVQSTRNGIGIPPYRLATGGTDSHVVIWYVFVKECGLASVEVAADLQRHQRAVNTVRFSPSGQYLASGDDESVIIIWKPKTEHDISELSGTEGDVSKEQWVSMKTLRGHLEDVYDICWSLDSTHLISGSIDNTAIVWDVHKGRSLGILSGHAGFVQGVAWDPKNKYVATLSSDRTCRIHNVFTRKLTAKISKTTLPVPQGSELDGKTLRLFHDDTLKSFFRRLAFSPDGELLVTPSGVIEMPNSEKHINATYIFTRYDFSRPVVYLPSPHEYTVTVRFCPLLFKLGEGSSLFPLPYRMVFAVSTKSNVILYDTQQPEPIAFISNIHYTRLTDLSWSGDGRVLVASSTDGYCSIITFSEKELGEIYEPPKEITENEGEFQISVGKQVHNSDTEVSLQESSPDARKSTEQIGEEENSVVPDAEDGKNLVKRTATKQVSPVLHEVNTMQTQSERPVSETKSQRRISLITLSSPRKRPASTPDSVVKRSSVHLEQTSSSDIEGNTANKVQNGSALSGSISKDSDASNMKESTLMNKSSNENSVVVGVKETMITDSNSKDNENVILDGAERRENVSESAEFHTTASNREKAVTTEDCSHENSADPMEVDESPRKEALENTEKPANTDVELSRTSASSCAGDGNADSRNESLDEEKQEVRGEGLNRLNSSNTTNQENSESALPKDKVTGSSTDNKIPDENAENACEMSPAKVSNVELVYETTPSKCVVNKTVNLGAETTETLTATSVKGDEVSIQEIPTSVTPVQNRTPRRVQFITISSPKSKKKLV